MADTTLFISNKKYSSWSMRPWVLMKALGLTFDEQLVPFDGPDRQTAFETFSPTGKVPCLQTGDTMVWESLAIIEYVHEHDARVWPAGLTARTWARSAAAEMHAGFAALRDECSMNCQLVIAHREPSPALTRELERLDILWCEGLTRFNGPWLAGSDFTAVDAFYAPVAVRIRGYNLTLSRPATDYAERLLAHPTVDEWVQAGIHERLEEPGHHRDCIRGRPILRDLRTAG